MKRCDHSASCYPVWASMLTRTSGLFTLNPNPRGYQATLMDMHAGQVDPRGKTWNRLRASIGQPNFVDVEAEEPAEEQADTVREEESIKVPQMS